MIRRGSVYDVDWPGAGVHPAVVVTRQVAIPVLRNVAVVLVTSTVREVVTEVRLGKDEGLERDCVVNCDNILTIPKTKLGRYRGSLGPAKTQALKEALRIALELD